MMRSNQNWLCLWLLMSYISVAVYICASVYFWRAEKLIKQEYEKNEDKTEKYESWLIIIHCNLYLSDNFLTLKDLYR